jgi:hypothetical protein
MPSRHPPTFHVDHAAVLPIPSSTSGGSKDLTRRASLGVLPVQPAMATPPPPLTILSSLTKDHRQLSDLLHTMKANFATSPSPPVNQTNLNLNDRLSALNMAIDRLKRDITKRAATVNYVAQIEQLLTELSNMKQQLSKVMYAVKDRFVWMQQQQTTHITDTTHSALAQLCVDKNWVYASVTSPHALSVHTHPTTSSVEVAQYQHGQRILVMYKIVETTDGLWMPTRLGDIALTTQRYWIRISDVGGRLNVGNFRVVQ